MAIFAELIKQLGQRFGVLAESNTYQLTVIAGNRDVAVGDLFVMPSQRGEVDRFYIFRTTQYANILNRALEVNDIARNKLTMPDAYLSEDLADEKLLELKGIILGYAEYDSAKDIWTFNRPRRLPDHLTDVYRVNPNEPGTATIMLHLFGSQLGSDGLALGELLAGEQPLKGVWVNLPPFALSHHIGIFGRTGSGKSNLMMVLLKSILDHNRLIRKGERTGQKGSIFAIDPHDEFRRWHYNLKGGADGIHGIVMNYDAAEQQDLVKPFYYLSVRQCNPAEFEQTCFISRADVVPGDLGSIIEFSEQQSAFANGRYSEWGEEWIQRMLMLSPEDDAGGYLPGTVSAVKRRLGCLERRQTKVVTAYDPDMGDNYNSLLPDIICALEQGRVLVVDTTLMSETEQFLVTTVVARTLFSLRRALRSVVRPADLPDAVRQAFDVNDKIGQIGLRTLAEELIKRIKEGQLPYVIGDSLNSTDRLPYVNVVVEEAPSVLNPQRMKFGSIFRDISRQGRKFGIGLTVVSQQVSEIDDGILTQLNTELIMSLGNENERKEAIRNASADMTGFERELQVMGKGQVVVSASYKDVPLPIQVPNYDDLTRTHF